MKRAIAVAAVLIAAAAVYSVVDPAQSEWVPKCPFRLLTGFDCPACGNQRALHRLLHGRLAEAFLYNPFTFIVSPYVAAVAFTSLSNSRTAVRMRPVVQNPIVVRVFVALTVAWWIFRNTPLWHSVAG